MDLFNLILGVLASLFRSKANLQAEILILRQQIIVLRRRAPKRPHLNNIAAATGSGRATRLPPRRPSGPPSRRRRSLPEPERGRPLETRRHPFFGRRALPVVAVGICEVHLPPDKAGRQVPLANEPHPDDQWISRGHFKPKNPAEMGKAREFTVKDAVALGGLAELVRIGLTPAAASMHSHQIYAFKDAEALLVVSQGPTEIMPAKGKGRPTLFYDPASPALRSEIVRPKDLAKIARTRIRGRWRWSI